MTRLIAAMVAVLGLTSAVSAWAQTWVAVDGGAWALDAVVLPRIEAELERVVETSAKAQGQKMPPWSEYTVQYQARLLEGHRMVWIMGACRVDPAFDLHKSFWQIKDGGPCYFHVTYSVDSGTFSDVLFNGSA
jgi:hypothetical protein